jgi:hydrophobic/amphiphilic exporter-1 (mainly G- bacteria), HAE1 family
LSAPDRCCNSAGLTSRFLAVNKRCARAGRLYQQFALTIAISVLLSAFNALTLSPALAGLLLKPAATAERRGLLGKFFKAFNGYFERSTHSFVRVSGNMIRKGSLVLALLAACVINWSFL